ncbi:MAG: transposase [Verrucomicrobia bacterium]|nr:transposase [Verrucomicrobiota bacterium]
MSILTFQPALRPPLPLVHGSLDYSQQRRLFERIDTILAESKLDAEFLALAIQDQQIDLAKASAKQLRAFVRFNFVCLRASIARKLTGLAHREFCARLADSPLLQWFLHVGQIDQVKIFAKSTSHRFDSWLKPESLRKINDRLIALSIAQQPECETTRQPFDLKQPIVIDEAFFDTTCIKTQMHFPIDWVLLRDAVRTLVKGTLCIRKAGLKQRMPQEPRDFLCDMNKLCMAMSAQRRAKDGKKSRKAILRQMKKLARRVNDHAQAHLDVLAQRRAETDLSEGQARVITQRLENVIKQLPAAIKQAHERIIGERQVRNEDKILSLYDGSVDIIVRGKAGAEVEFGNKLSLVESRQGLIIDYHLHRENISDSKLVEPSLQRIIGQMKLDLKKLWADRGMFSRSNEALLKAYGIQSGLCPRNPADLKERLADPAQREGMKRRGSTEARVAIFKNVILGNPARGKSIEAREQACGWAVLSHNLWVLARMPQADKVPRGRVRLEERRAA